MYLNKTTKTYNKDIDVDFASTPTSCVKISYKKNGQLHRDEDKPAVISRYFLDTDKKKWSYYWYKNGSLHRDDDNPAVIVYNGIKTNIEGLIMDDYLSVWYKNGVKHRDNGKPAYVEKFGSQEWWVNGKLHRENGPAQIFKYSMEDISEEDVNDIDEDDLHVEIYSQKGVMHNLNGPAYVSKFEKSYYINGVEYTKEEYNKQINVLKVFLNRLKQKVAQKFLYNDMKVCKEMSEYISLYV